MAVATLLRDRVREKMRKENWWSEQLDEEIPKRWEKHGNLILFPSVAFRDDLWRQANSEFWELVCKILHGEKLARKTGPTKDDAFRRPRVELLYGDNPWLTKKENGILYTWDITKCMFSSGNITEKLRVSSWDCSGEVVVDLYAGIGYFTLSYLVHAKAQLVYACEWNPDAISALRNNLKLNCVEDRCIVLPGDNEVVCPRQIADHVNLGLLPTSEKSWGVACRALKKTGGVLHIHDNVDCLSSVKNDNSDTIEFCEEKISTLCPSLNFPIPWQNWAVRATEKIHSILKFLYDESWTVKISHIHKVKSYGPHIDHLVLDLICKPKLPT